MHHLRHCVNPKVVGVVALAGAAIWLVAPGSFSAFAPALFLAICPLSMAAMVLLMRGGSRQAPVASAAPSVGVDGSAALQARVEQLERELALRDETGR